MLLYFSNTAAIVPHCTALCGTMTPIFHHQYLFFGSKATPPLAIAKSEEGFLVEASRGVRGGNPSLYGTGVVFNQRGEERKEGAGEGGGGGGGDIV